MSPFSSDLPGTLQDAGLVLGLFMTLTISSYLIRDNFLARLGQYVLVGAGLGYMAVLAWSNVLWPRLFAPLISGPSAWLLAPEQSLLTSGLPLLLGLLMWGGGVELLFRPSGRPGRRQFLRLLAVIPAAILGGVGLGVGVSGAVQGTLWPQFTAAFQFSQGDAFGASQAPNTAGQALWLVRFFTLLITGGVLIHLQLGRTAGANENGPSPQQSSQMENTESVAERRESPFRVLMRSLLLVWEGIGRRALWLAAGIVFARLVAARFSLVLARLDYLMFDVPRSELWQLLWAAVRGAGS